MKRILFVFIVLYQSVFVCFAQNEQKIGFVRTYQEKKAIHTRDIYIRHFKSKDTVFVETYSDFDGKFSIIFPQKTEYPTSITVRGNGAFKDYGVVNTYDINNIKATDKNIDVFIGSKKVIEEQRKYFYDVITNPIIKQYSDSIRQITNVIAQGNISQDSIQKLYAVIENLEQELKNKNQKIEEISEELKILQADYLKLRNSPELMQERIHEILLDSLEITLNYFNNGQLDKALSSNPVTQKTVEQDKGIKLIKFFLTKLKAMTFVSMGDYQNALTWYKNTFVYIDSENKIDWFFIYMNIAELEHLTGNDNNAVKYVEEADKIAINRIYKIKAYNLWGKILESQGKDKNFYKKYNEAIALYKKLKNGAVIEGIIDDEHIAEKEAAISYTLLADYYKDKKRKEAAKTNYHEALDIYTELNKIGEIETEAQCIILFKLITIYGNENKVPIAEKCFNRITLLAEIDSTIVQNPKIIMQLALFDMQYGFFSEAGQLYAIVLEYYKENQNKKLYQQELIETMFLSGLNQFYAKSYYEAFYYFSQTDSVLSSKEDIALFIGEKDYMRLKALCMAAMGITMKERGNKEKGLALYNEAIKMISDDKLSKEEKMLLKDIKHLKKYSKLGKIDIIIKSVGGVGGFAILVLPLLIF